MSNYCTVQDIVDSVCCYCSGNPKDGTFCPFFLNGTCVDVIEYVKANQLDDDSED